VTFVSKNSSLCPGASVFGAVDACKFAYQNFLVDSTDESNGESKDICEFTRDSTDIILESNNIILESNIKDSTGGSTDTILESNIIDSTGTIFESTKFDSTDILANKSNAESIKMALAGSSFRVISKFREIQSPKVVFWDSFYGDIGKLPKAAPGLEFFGHSFPQESFITCKDYLSVLLKRLQPSWYPITYCVSDSNIDSGSMLNEFPIFIGHWMEQQRTNPDTNVWIVKPATSSRSRGIFVDRDLKSLLHHLENVLEQFTRSVVSQYILNPVLFKGLKFDLRFFVALKSIDEYFVYDEYIVRHALSPYDPNSNLNHIPTHMTVLQYFGIEGDTNCSSDDFLQFMEAEYGIQVHGVGGLIHKCHRVIAELFDFSTSQHIGSAGEIVGLLPDARSRALYGIDIMLHSLEQPMVLEVNYKPDLARILERRPNFLIQTMELLFQNQPAEENLFLHPRGCFVRLSKL